MVGEITITDRAADKIRARLAGVEEGHGLRVKVVEGGCSGFEYKMDIDSPWWHVVNWKKVQEQFEKITG